MNTLKNNIKTIAALTALALSSAATASTEDASSLDNVKYTGDMKYAGFCKAVVENSVDGLRLVANRSVGDVAASRRGVIRAVTADNGVTCNGKSLIEFSIEKNAGDVHAFLVAQR